MLTRHGYYIKLVLSTTNNTEDFVGTFTETQKVMAKGTYKPITAATPKALRAEKGALLYLQDYAAYDHNDSEYKNGS